MVLTVLEKDLLEQDPAIRGQTYACVSFLSPEEIIKRQDTFYFEKYIEHFSKQVGELFEGINSLSKDVIEREDQIHSIKEQYNSIFDPTKINDEYKYFVANNEEMLDKTFNDANDFQTNVRGIKIRGVYDSVNEAQLRCESLRKLDCNKFSIYVCEVGCWCPWSPNPDSIANQEYAIDSLNTLMNEYEKNNQDKDAHYAERKHNMKDRIRASETVKAEQNKSENEAAQSDQSSFDDICLMK